MAGKNANVRNSLPQRKYPLAIASAVLLHQKEREKKKGSWKAATSPGLESAVEPALGEGGVGNKYAGLRGGLHPPNEDGESGERTSRSMPVLAPGFVSRLQPPINTTHNPSSSPLRRDSSAELSPLHVRIFSNEHAIVDSLRGGAK